MAVSERLRGWWYWRYLEGPWTISIIITVVCRLRLVFCFKSGGDWGKGGAGKRWCQKGPGDRQLVGPMWSYSLLLVNHGRDTFFLSCHGSFMQGPRDFVMRIMLMYVSYYVLGMAWALDNKSHLVESSWALKAGTWFHFCVVILGVCFFFL